MPHLPRRVNGGEVGVSPIRNIPCLAGTHHVEPVYHVSSTFVSGLSMSTACLQRMQVATPRWEGLRLSRPPDIVGRDRIVRRQLYHLNKVEAAMQQTRQRRAVLHSRDFQWSGDDRSDSRVEPCHVLSALAVL